jgi:superfamily II DNA/RNA helicase
LQDLGVNASALHGDLTQSAREKAIERFTNNQLKVLVATDVAARGIDIDDVACVVHYVPPIDTKAYLHRSGRTARAGRDGWAVTLAEYNQHTTCRIIQRALRLKTEPPVEVFSNDARLQDLNLFL